MSWRVLCQPTVMGAVMHYLDPQDVLNVRATCVKFNSSIQRHDSWWIAMFGAKAQDARRQGLTRWHNLCRTRMRECENVRMEAAKALVKLEDSVTSWAAVSKALKSKKAWETSTSKRKRLDSQIDRGTNLITHARKRKRTLQSDLNTGERHLATARAHFVHAEKMLRSFDTPD